MPAHTERELTFAVDARWDRPDMSAALPAGSHQQSDDHQLKATYLDTPSAALRGLGITLRRRTGGHDAGWHLKVPSGDARIERQSRSRSAAPPKAMVQLVNGLLGEEELVEVATITTRRRSLRVCDPQDRLVLEVADNSVHGQPSEGSEPATWREIEVELGPAGTEEDLRSVADLLVDAGAEERGVTRKLDRVLGPLDEAGEDALSTYVKQECRSALLGELGLRDGVDVDGVHDTRVSIRRIRSTLRLFADLLTPEAEVMDDELRWLAGLLSDVRDADVLDKHLHAKIAALPPELVMGPVHDELDTTIGQDRDAALRRWRHERDGTRYTNALGVLNAWSRQPPLREPLKDKQLAKVGSRILEDARRKARSRLRRAGHDPVLTHRARKAVKRYRYAANLLEGLVPGAKKDGNRAKDVQSVLGDHQDLVVEADFLRHQAARVGGRERHNGFTYGLLMARAEREAADIRARPPTL